MTESTRPASGVEASLGPVSDLLTLDLTEFYSPKPQLPYG